MVDDRTLDERGGSSTATPAEPTIGRYRIEGKLGAGGMGVVYAAYDPELERRVALKLLAQSGASRASRERLLREARAMARLSHPNVVVVYEVGTTDDRDFVAMELVDGSSLDHWLEHDHPSRRAIIAAFVAAGRGLAAAHAAGIVHRDFKPHNVLRRRDGNIQVGDFGLAVDVADEPEPVEPRSRNTPSPLGGLTETGAVLGTPAYMAPEQWRGDTVGPAADQFAFCVALWEALAGALPYRGDHESLRAAVMRGPHELDATAIPRGLRAALSRGLAPDPARRWPSMSALLATIERTQRSVAVPIALGAATCAIVATIGILLVHRSADQAAASPLRCDAPVLDPDRVWPEGSVARLGAGQAAAANRLDRELDTWRTVRQLSCLSGDAGALKCLDGVLSQFDAVARAVTTAKRPVETSQLLDPIVCLRAEPPRLQRTLSDASRALIALMTDDIALESLTPEAADHLVADAANDPCARAFATMIAAGTKPNDAARRDELAVAETAAARCGADDVIARVALAAANDEILYSRTDDLALARLQRVEPAVMRVPDAELVGQLDLLRMREARSAHRIDDAIAHGEAAVARFRERDCFDCVVSATTTLEDLRDGRGDDRGQIYARLTELHRLGVARLGASSPVVRGIDIKRATMLFENGDVAGAHAMLVAAHGQEPNSTSRRVTGRVVDAAHRPIAGATVTAAESLIGDSATAAEVFDRGSSTRAVTSDANGEFVIADAVEHGVIVAELGALRSPPVQLADHVELAVGPTSRIEGRVELDGVDPTSIGIDATGTDRVLASLYQVSAPVGRDGRFVLDGLQRGATRVRMSPENAMQPRVQVVTVAVDAPLVRGVELAAKTTHRTIPVVVRASVGDSIPSAQVMIFEGKIAAKNLLELQRVSASASADVAVAMRPELVPDAVKAVARRGDVIATITGVPVGPATVCALAQPKDNGDDPDLQRKIVEHLDRLELRCVPLAPTDTQIVLEVPPFPRL